MNANALVLAAPRKVELHGSTVPEPSSGEARVRVAGSGVCGSDLAAWQGREWFRYPMRPGAPGHEAWGTIDALATDVTHLNEGQAVVGLVHEAFADAALTSAEHLIPIPDGLRGQPLPAEAIACAVNASERAAIHPGERVAIIGIGFLGAIIVQLARNAGADVTAISRREYPCRLADRLGAHRSVQAHARQHADRVRDAAGSEPFDTVIEVTGHQASLDLATDLVRVGGRLVIAGYHQEPRQIDMQQWNWKGIDVINAHERDPTRYLDGIRTGFRLMNEDRLVVRPLVTHEFDIAEAADAFRAMEEREDGFLKGVIRT